MTARTPDLKLTPAEKEHFWSRVQPATDDRCWPWMKSTFRGGYGQVYLQGYRGLKAHRVAFYIANGYWPKVGRHSCDNPLCCNPRHILDGSWHDNTQDMLKRGRCNPPVGERSGHAKLTEEQVLSIRAEHATGTTSYTKLAAKYGVTYTLIGHIMTRSIWKHI